MNDFLKKLFGSQPTRPADAMPPEFHSYASRAIALLAGSNGELEDGEVLALFSANDIPHKEATELLLFLPTAFCRYMLPQIDWPTYYVEYFSEAKQIQIKYADNPRFVAIQQEMTAYLAGEFMQDDFLKIAGRCASFKVINQLLLAGGKLENAGVSPEYVVR